MTTICPLCQLDHEALGVELVGRVLLRRAHGPLHRLRMFGGAFAFSAKLFDAHFAGESGFCQLQIHDVESGEVFFADKETLEKAERMTLSLEHGPQVIIPIGRMVRTRTRPTLMGGPERKEAATGELARSLPRRSGEDDRFHRARRRHAQGE